MKMKKSLIAAAVASVCAAPMAAQAEPTVWGEFVAGIEHANDDLNSLRAAAGGIAPAGESSMHLALDSANFGIETSEDLGNGLMVTAGTEVAIGEGSYGSGAVGLGFDNTFAALSGDFGSLQAGWGVDSAYYLHVQAPQDVGMIYDTYSFSGWDTSSNSLQYGYEGGPVSISAEVIMREDLDDLAAAGNNNSPDTFDGFAIAGTFDAGVVSVGAGHATVTNSTTGGAEPSNTGFSVSGSAGPVDLSGSYQMQDFDTGAAQGDEPSAIDLIASMGFGGGLGGQVGLNMVDADTNSGAGDTNTVHLQVSQAVSNRTSFFGQLMSASIDGGPAPDVDPRGIFVGMEHAF